MSSLLEQAIVDAAALKEAAMKNAEVVVIEKYSSKIEEAISSMLEQDDEMDLGMEDPDGEEDLGGIDIDVGGLDGEEPGASDLDVPLAATDGEKLCPCAEDDEELEINFDELEQQIGAGDDLDAGDMTDRDEFAAGLEREEDVLAEGDESEEEIEISESDLEELAEELMVDLKPAKSGHLDPPPSQTGEMANMALAADAATVEIEDEILPIPPAQEEEEEEDRFKTLYENVKKENKTLRKNHIKVKTLLIKVKDKIQEMNTANSRLIYVNKALGNTSLNERQKKNLVESISNAKNGEMAKMVYESVINAMEEKRTISAPKSLLEAANRKPKMSLLTSRAKPENRDESKTHVNRWQKLAGIKQNK